MDVFGRGGVFTLDVFEGLWGLHFGRGKLRRITQACGNRRFTASDDSGSGKAPEVQTVPTKPPGAILEPEKSYSTRRGGADDGGISGDKKINIQGGGMTFDQKVQLWMVVGVWVAGLATFAAVVTSLYFSRTKKVRLKIFVSIRRLIVVTEVLVKTSGGTP